MKPYIIIDSGHCVHTLGKRSPDGTLREYEFNYYVSNKIMNHLLRCGIKAEVQQIVDKNSRREVNTRVQNINRKNPDAVVSIHANAHINDWTDAHGWEIYVCKLDPSRKSNKLAKAIHDASIPALGIADRGIKAGNMALVCRTNPPAVLIEHAFMTNRKECELLKTQAFREKCAEADAKGICKYFNVPWIPAGKADNSELNKYAETVKNRFGLEEQTLQYLKNYKYAQDLLRKLATAD